MPKDLHLERLDDGNGIESTLKAHGAEWHKKCRLKFNKKAFDEQSRGDVARHQDQVSSRSHQTSRSYALERVTNRQTDRHTDTTKIVVTAGAHEPIQPTSTQGSDIKEKTSKMEPIGSFVRRGQNSAVGRMRKCKNVNTVLRRYRKS